MYVRLIGVACIVSSWNLGPNDVCLNMMPLFHIGTCLPPPSLSVLFSFFLSFLYFCANQSLPLCVSFSIYLSHSLTLSHTRTLSLLLRLILNRWYYEECPVSSAERWVRHHMQWLRSATLLVHSYTCCAVLWCCAVLCCAVLCCAVLYCTVLYCTVLYCTVLYCTVLY